jgi:hypothetical protein
VSLFGINVPSFGEVLEAIEINRARALNAGSSVGTKVVGPGSPGAQAATTGALAAGALTGGAVLAATAGETAAAGGAGAGGGAASGGAAGGAGGGAAGKVAGAASSAAGTLTKDVLAGGLAVGLAELGKAYGVRILEVAGGGALLMFGLATLARGGKPPDLPKVVPVPV